MKHRRYLLFLLSAAAVALVAGAATAALQRSSHSTTSTALAFGHEVVVDHQRVDGEPSLTVSPKLNATKHHDIYVSAPYGFSTTASFVWKSEDGGKTFHLIGDESPAALGKPALTCAGGGDSSIAVDSGGNFYFTDLQGLTNVSDSVSTDGGDTFTTTCNTANDAGVDRPWIAVQGNPLTTGREYMAVDQVEQCDPDQCGLGQTGSNELELTQTSGTPAKAQVFSPIPAQQIEPDGIVGGVVVNQKSGAVYVVHTAFTNAKGQLVGGGDANGNTNAIVVDAFPHGYTSTTPTPVTGISLCKPYNAAGPCTSETVVHSPLDKAGNSSVNNGQDFSPIAIDRAGNLYVTWAQSPVNSAGTTDGPTTIYMATSSNGGKTWTKPIDVSKNVTGLKTNVFPWLAAGSRGRVDLVWYGSSTLGKCPGSPCGAGFINAKWNVFFAQTLNAVSTKEVANPAPTFKAARVTEYSNHYGQICEFGIACTTGGDRGLVDFIQVQALPSGAAGIVWADGANSDFNGGETSPVIAYTAQRSGPGLYGGYIHGAAPLFRSAPGSPAAYYAANGSETAAGAKSNLQIVNSSVTPSGTNYVVTMKVASLASLQPSATLGGEDALWLTRWELPTAKPTSANQGHVYYAAMESDAGGTPTFYAGASVCGITAQHCKTLAYPPNFTVKGSYTKAGLIRIVVPMKDVGGSGRIFSVTGVTATQASPGSTGTTVFNVIDSTAPYDAK